MAEIRVLEPHVADLIAAGEVVERPASVVKELVENAVDAGATQITVSIEAGGVRFIEVSDDGSGIEAAYVGKAFLCHATSKLTSGQDLFRVKTLGFRGEALSSIASVARVELLTKTEQDEFACLYRIEGGQEIGVEAGARGVGTTIRVKDLFYNTPARLKFLKKDASEGTFVAEVMEHAALSHPEIKFKFIREGKVQYVTPGDGQLSSVIYTVLGKEFARDLVKVDGQISHYSVSGFVTPPHRCRASRSMQSFFVNGRYVKNRTMAAALEAAYRGTTMQGKFPGGVLMLELPLELVDVNVHPAKIEVRFSRENDIFDAVYHAVKSALDAYTSNNKALAFSLPEAKPAAAPPSFANVVQPSLASVQVKAMPVRPSAKPVVSSAMYPKHPDIIQSHPAEAEEDIFQPAVKKPLSMGSPILDAPGKHFSTWNANESVLDIQPDVPEAVFPAKAVVEPAQKVVPDENIPVTGEVGQEPASECVAEQTTLLPEPEQEPLRFIGEIFRTYILAEWKDSLCLIDKHAAHERILYEKLKQSYRNVSGQLLLSPQVVHLSAEEKTAILSNEDMLTAAGLRVDDFGGNSVLVREVPCDVPVVDAEQLVVELADRLVRGSKDAIPEKTEWVLHSIACRAAIKAGDKSTAEELLYLAQDILTGKIPPFCPHGRPCVINLTKKELEKQFGRIV